MTVYWRAKFEKRIGSAVGMPVSVSENCSTLLMAILRLKRARKNEKGSKTGCGAGRASKTTFKWPKGGGFFPPPNKKEEVQTKDWLLCACAQPIFFCFQWFAGKQGSGMAPWNGEYFRESRGSAGVSR